MRAEELTAQFGIAGILDFEETEDGLAKAVISLDGMAGELYLQGAQLTAGSCRRSGRFSSQAPGVRLRRVEQFAVASRSSSRGSALVGTARRRHSMALHVLRCGISTGSKLPAASR